MKAVVVALASLMAATANAGINVSCVDSASQAKVVISQDDPAFGSTALSVLGIGDSLSIDIDGGKEDIEVYVDTIKSTFNEATLSGSAYDNNSQASQVDVSLRASVGCGMALLGSTAKITITDGNSKVPRVLNLQQCGRTSALQPLI